VRPGAPRSRGAAQRSPPNTARSSARAFALRLPVSDSARPRRPLLRNGQRGAASPPRWIARRPQSRACDRAPTATRPPVCHVRRSSQWPCCSRASSAARSARMQSRPQHPRECSFGCSRHPRWPCGSQASTGALREPAAVSAGARAPFCRKSALTPQARGCCRSSSTQASSAQTGG